MCLYWYYTDVMLSFDQCNSFGVNPSALYTQFNSRLHKSSDVGGTARGVPEHHSALTHVSRRCKYYFGWWQKPNFKAATRRMFLLIMKPCGFNADASFCSEQANNQPQHMYVPVWCFMPSTCWALFHVSEFLLTCNLLSSWIDEWSYNNSGGLLNSTSSIE